jgi:U2 small nuclear ribonucleoprotein A'
VLCAPQFTNPLREREIKLRAFKIPAIENLGATQDQFDTVDLSDNEIRKLEVLTAIMKIFPGFRLKDFGVQNFPLLRRVKTLLLSNNLIFRIGEDLNDSLPALHTLMLANNNILNLQDLLPLANLSKLERLVLIDNNVTKQPNYRLFVINLLPKLLVLDFKKVKPKVLVYLPSQTNFRPIMIDWQEREAAKKFFESGDAPKLEDLKKATEEQRIAIKVIAHNILL